MQFRLSHLLILTGFAAVSVGLYSSLPEILGAHGAFGKLGIGLAMLGLFICMFVIYMLRLPTALRSSIQSDDPNNTSFDGQHWLDFLFPWITGSLFVFLGCYSVQFALSGDPIPRNWWIPLLPAIAVLVSYIPVWRYLRTI